VLIHPDAGRSTTDVGEFEGICSASPSRSRAFYVGASCWWQGRTLEIAVIERDHDLIALSRTEEGERELARIAIPDHSHVYPVGADEPAMPAPR
jgi:hypothetical protein